MEENKLISESEYSNTLDIEQKYLDVANSLVEQLAKSSRWNCEEFDSQKVIALFLKKNERILMKETMEEKENSVVVNNEHKQLKVHSLRHDKVILMIDDKYELKQEGGAYYIVKKQSQYPKTYEECCDILRIPNDERYIDIDVPLSYNKLLTTFTKILICRDAYWKMAGDWKPDWGNGYATKYVVTCVRNEIQCQNAHEYQRILAFHAKEMRDAFYENFKELIESCKELL